MSNNSTPTGGQVSSAAKYLSDKHLAEWCKGSGVYEAIAKLNVTSLTDRTVIAKLINWRTYPNCNPLGWWASGLDLSTMEPQTFGQFKPDELVRMSPEDEDGSKYLSVKGGQYDAIALRHPDEKYWQHVIDDPSHPIAITEGGKKAGLLITCDHPALALCGVTMGLKKGGKELVKNLEILAVQGRPITVVFDSDLATNTDIQRALKALATVLKQKGCVVFVAVIPLELESKGIDDVWANHESAMVNKIMADAIPYSAWLKSLEARMKPPTSKNNSDRKSPKYKDGEEKAVTWGESTAAKAIADKYRNKLAWHIDAQCWMRYEAENKGIWGEEPEEVVKNVVIAELDKIADQKAWAKHQAKLKCAQENLEKAEEARQDFAAKAKKERTGKEPLSEEVENRLQILEQMKEGEVEFRRAAIQKLEENPADFPYTHGFTAGVMKFLQSSLGVKHWDEGAASGLIPLKNGVFNYSTREFSEHNSGNKITWTLPYDYNPVATCEPIVQWLEEAAGDKQIARLLIAYLKAILNSRTDIHRLLELVGPGGSGKSTYARLAQALIGTQNTHTTTLAKLEGSRFETACLWNKRLAIVNDSERYAGNVTILKAASGGDTIPHEVKFVQSRRGFTFDGKFILTSNEIIQSSDYTSGLERRRITVPFTNRIPVERQRNLIEIKGDTVSGEFTEYLPGLFNLIVNMPDEEMEALLRDTDKLCPALGESKAENLLDTNPIAAWLDYCVVHDPDSRSQIGLAIPQKDKDIPAHFLNVDKFLYPSYCNYSKNSGSRTPLGLQRFVKLLEDLVKNQLKIDGVFREKDRSKKSYFVGLRIRQDGGDDDLPSPIFEYTSGKVRRDCGGMRGGMKPIQRRDAGDAEGLLKKSENVEQNFQATFCSEQISPTEELKSPSASPEVPRQKDLNPPHIPPHIPPHPSAPSEANNPESIASGEFAGQIRNAITTFDRSLAIQISRALKGKTELKKEVRAALTVDEFDNFRLLVIRGFIKGTRVKYIGAPKYAEQYEGLELEVYSIDEHSLITCLKPNGAGYTTRLKPEELEIIS